MDGKGVLITGGRRIGAAVAVALAGQGAQIALSFNRSRAEAEEVAAAVEAGGGRAFVHQADLSKAPEARTLVDRAAADMGRLDVLINMASVYASMAFEELDENVWDSVVNVDLRAAYLCSRAAVPHRRSDFMSQKNKPVSAVRKGRGAHGGKAGSTLTIADAAGSAPHIPSETKSW